jgi:threonine dehydratase
MCRSVPQIEAVLTRTSTSVGPIAGTATESICSPLVGRVFRNAFIVVAIYFGSRSTRKSPMLAHPRRQLQSAPPATYQKDGSNCLWTLLLTQWLNVRMTVEPTIARIREAQASLASHFPATRLVAAPALSQSHSIAYLKLEIDLPTASFKPRGALFALAHNLRKRSIEEVIACSTGNHGAAVAYAAKTFGLPATIFLPANPNPVKRKRIADLGARIVEAGGPDCAHAFQQAKEYSTRPGVFFLNDATDPDLPAGPATIGLEILAQLPEVTAIYVPMGDTALIRGAGAAVRQTNPNVKVIGVQAERAPSYYLSWKAGRAISTDSCDTCADGLATRTPEPENVRAIRELVDDVVLVTEEEMLQAIRLLYERMSVIAEPAGAAATAAFLNQPPSSGPVVLLVTGANISDSVRLQAGLPPS